MARAADQSDGLIDPVGMNAHRAVRRVCDFSFNSGCSSLFPLIVQPTKIRQLRRLPGLNEAIADQSIDVELKPKLEGYSSHSFHPLIEEDAFHLQ